jgi:hypothetical protein
MKRELRPLAALAVLAAIVAGCSKAPADTGATTSTAATHDKAMRFSACMRDHGVGAFPDPDASGELTIDAVANGSSLDTDSAAFEQALSACKDLQPPGFTGHKRSARTQEIALKFAQCVRDNGVEDFPDPTAEAPLVDTNRIPSTERNGGMSVLNAAMQKCGVTFAGKLGVTRP